MKEITWLLCFILLGEAVIILYLLGMLKDTTREYSRALKSVTEDVLLALKASNSFELSQARAFQKDQDMVREQLEKAPSIPFTPDQATPSTNTIRTKDGKELQILRPRV